MSRPTNLVLVPPSPGLPDRPGRIVCEACSAHFGCQIVPKVTIRPQTAIRLASGAIVIEAPDVICSSCLGRGLETVL